MRQSPSTLLCVLLFLLLDSSLFQQSSALCLAQQLKQQQQQQQKRTQFWQNAQQQPLNGEDHTLHEGTLTLTEDGAQTTAPNALVMAMLERARGRAPTEPSSCSRHPNSCFFARLLFLFIAFPLLGAATSFGLELWGWKTWALCFGYFFVMIFALGVVDTKFYQFPVTLLVLGVCVGFILFISHLTNIKTTSRIQDTILGRNPPAVAAVAATTTTLLSTQKQQPIVQPAKIELADSDSLEVQTATLETKPQPRAEYTAQHSTASTSTDWTWLGLFALFG